MRSPAGRSPPVKSVQMKILLASIIGLTATAILTGAAIGAARQTNGAALHRPNILWISNEDMSPRLGVLRRHRGAHAGLDRLARESVRYTRAFTTAPGLRTEPRGDHHRDVSDAIGAQHMRTTEDTRAGAARTLPGRAAVLREGVSRVPAGGRLLHDEPREDRLPVRRPFTIWDELGRQRALAQPRRQEPAVLLGVQPRGHAREPDLPVEPGPQGQAARDRPDGAPGAAVLSGHAGGARRARADVRQHRRHGRAGRRDPEAARGRRAGGRTRSSSTGAITATACRARSDRSTTPGCACR